MKRINADTYYPSIQPLKGVSAKKQQLQKSPYFNFLLKNNFIKNYI